MKFWGAMLGMVRLDFLAGSRALIGAISLLLGGLGMIAYGLSTNPIEWKEVQQGIAVMGAGFSTLGIRFKGGPQA